MDYKTKYLKYKKKYLKLSQRGGFNIPNQPKKTQSWFFMPFILSSFTDVVVEFTEPIYKSCDDLNIKFDGLIGTLQDNIEIFKKYLIGKNIDLSDRRNLLKINNVFFDDTKYSHLTSDSQDYLLNEVGIREKIEKIALNLIEKNGGEEYKFYIKDYMWINVNDYFTNVNKVIKIQNINKRLYDISNKQIDEKNKTYKIYDDVDVVMREAVDSNDVVIICFGYWGDLNFQLFYTLNKNHSGMILYFIDRDKK